MTSETEPKPQPRPWRIVRHPACIEVEDASGRVVYRSRNTQAAELNAARLVELATEMPNATAGQLAVAIFDEILRGTE